MPIFRTRHGMYITSVHTCIIYRHLIRHRRFEQETDSYIIFPREKPGLDYKLNWSLAADDITPSGDAYRNADKAVLDKESGKAPSGGDSKVLEAGDTVSFEAFDLALAEIKAKLVRDDDE